VVADVVAALRDDHVEPDAVRVSARRLSGTVQPCPRGRSSARAGRCDERS
jgi:hypothetical protein